MCKRFFDVEASPSPRFISPALFLSRLLCGKKISEHDVDYEGQLVSSSDRNHQITIKSALQTLFRYNKVSN